MLLAITTLYFIGRGVHTYTLPSTSSSVLKPNAVATCDNLYHCRSLLNLIWNCLATIALCTWVSVHPNIPAPGKNASLHRTKLFITALLAPELIFWFALDQRIAARHWAKKYQSSGWTLTHGFFLTMGGFMLCEGRKPYYTLWPGDFEKLLNEQQIDFPDVTEEEIKDRSKADPLTKLVVILQTGWFILHLAARWARHLRIMELELVTFAFATLNVVTYLLWWDKPLNVICPLRVPCKFKPGWIQEDQEMEGVEMTVSDRGRDRVARLARTINNVALLVTRFMVSVVSGFFSAIKNSVLFMKRRGVLGTLGFPFVVMEFTIGRLVGEESEFNVYHELRVPSFYSGSPVWRPWDISLFGVAIIFGGIHCIAWNFTFPSHVEQMLWRASSVANVGIPALVPVIGWVFAKLGWIRIFYSVLLPLLSSFYSIARAILLVQAFVALRQLDPGAYEETRWTLYLPSIS